MIMTVSFLELHPHFSISACVSCILVVRIGWEQLNYTVSETTVAPGQGCVIVFNPTTDMELPFGILFKYQSIIGTAGITFI